MNAYDMIGSYERALTIESGIQYESTSDSSCYKLALVGLEFESKDAEENAKTR